MHPDIDRNVVNCAWNEELLEGRDDAFVVKVSQDKMIIRNYEIIVGTFTAIFIIRFRHCIKLYYY